MSKYKQSLLIALLLLLPLVTMAQIPPIKEKSGVTTMTNKPQKAVPVVVADTLTVEGIGGEDEDEEEMIPASEIYPEWSNSKVNPYNIKIDNNSSDSVSIDMSGFCFPLPKFYRVNSEFGMRRRRHHNGIDLKVYVGDSVVCVLDGMVRIAKSAKRGYGKHVVVRHNNGLETIYAHLNAINVTENQIVKAGELLGEGGNTGRSTGPHLHFEIRYLGQPMNPRDVVDFKELACHSDTLLLTKSNFSYVKEVEKGKVDVYVVRKGDTLSGIAQKTGVSVSRLCALNNISKTKILQIGQRIKCK